LYQSETSAVFRFRDVEETFGPKRVPVRGNGENYSKRNSKAYDFKFILVFIRYRKVVPVII
jgi:hypothetical protein